MNIAIKSLIISLLYQFSSVNALELIDPMKVIKQHGYSGEAHQVTTEDGYILQLFRIPKGLKKSTRNCPPVPIILAHGLGANSGYYMDYKSNLSLAYILADSGYDVWMMNARGNGYSKEHLTWDKERNQKEFFNFSLHEIGFYDIPATIDYILNLTNQTSLQYLGHSQGGTTFYIMASSRPEYNKKIKLATLFGAPTIMKNNRDRTSKALAKSINTIRALFDLLQIYHFPIYIDTIRGVLYTLCTQPIMANFCMGIIFTIAGFEDRDQFEVERLKVFFTYSPSDSSCMQYYHYAQFLNTGRFQRYDYGPKENQRIYDSEKPPDYDLRKVSAPLALYYSKNDQFLSVKDLESFAKILPNVALKKLIAYKKFNHVDYIVARDVRKLVYDDMLLFMEKYNDC